MIVTTTAVAFVTLAAGLGICGFLFLRAFSKENHSEQKGKIGKLLSWFFIGFAAPNAILGLASFFFAEQPSRIYYALLLSYVLLTILGIIGIYTAYYIFYPNQSPRYSIISMTALGLTTITVAIITHPTPFLTHDNAIDWNTHSPLSILLFLLLFSSIGSAFYIFTRLFLTARTTEIKYLAFIIALLAFAGMVQAFIEHVLFNNISDRISLTQDVGIGAIGVTFILLLGIAPAIKKFCAARSR